MKTARIERVADGVYAAIAEENGIAVGNAGFVDLGDQTLVFDTHVSLAAGRALRTAAEEHGPVGTVVLSHWHGDHVFGAGAFDAAVVATDRTADLMRERTTKRLAELRAAPLEDYAGTTFAELARTELPPSSFTSRKRRSSPSGRSAARRRSPTAAGTRSATRSSGFRRSASCSPRT